jgi:hypothetical protein
MHFMAKNVFAIFTQPQLKFNILKTKEHFYMKTQNGKADMYILSWKKISKQHFNYAVRYDKLNLLFDNNSFQEIKASNWFYV